MADTYTLDAQSRTVTGKKVGQLRVQGLVPAVIYGAKIQPIHLQVPYRALELTLRKAGGTNLIDVNIDGSVQTVLARSVQRDVIRGSILHVDFLAIDKSVKIATDIPVHLVGESPAVNNRQGVLQHDLMVLHVEALPGDLIDQVTIDISNLKLYGDHITVADLKLPSGVTALVEPSAVIVRIVGAKIVSEDGLDAAPVVAEVEVISKGKIDEDEA
ncbi:MAG: 50S ribosomal protein L25 [Chloroflexota bacterium]|nr:50S ribosomal protein L25 [Chloroflexota bacterium]